MNNKIIKGFAWGAFVLGVVVLVGFLVLFYKGEHLFGPRLNLDNAASLGTFVGGTVGALWA